MVSIKYATAFGIGQRTGIMGDQGESAGLLRPVSKWSGVSITHIPMGQEVLASPIQLVTAMSVIANGGKLMVPHLARQVTDETMARYGEDPYPAASGAPGHQRGRGEPSGEGAGAGDDHRHGERHQDHRLGPARATSYAGKTGTAQKFIDGAYSHDHHVASFIGFMPAQDPAFVCLVMVDDPHTKNYYGAGRFPRPFSPTSPSRSRRS